MYFCKKLREDGAPRELPRLHLNFLVAAAYRGEAKPKCPEQAALSHARGLLWTLGTKEF